MSHLADPSFIIQKQVRENTQDLERYMIDLKVWEDGMKKKEQSIFGDESNMKMETEAVTREDVNYVKGVFEDGKRQMKNKKWELAINSFTKAINRYKKNPVFFLKRAKCYLHLKKAKEAEVDCTRALSLDPKLLKAKYLRSQAREMLGNVRGACLDLQDIMILDPPNEEAKVALDRLKSTFMESLKGEKFELFEKEDNEGQSLILSSLVGRSDKTSEDAELDEKINNANREKEKGNALVKEKKWKEAKDAYSKAILYYPDDAIFYCNRALCHINTDNPQRAALDCTVALTKNPRYARAYLRRSAARKMTKDFWGARSDIKKTLLLEPNNGQAKTILEELNVLIEQKVYSDFGTPDSDYEMYEDATEEDVNDHMDDQASEPMEINKSDTTQAENCTANEVPSDSGHFTLVYPINKSQDKRSEKPLRRIPIKFTGKVEEVKPIQTKRNVTDLPEWLNSPLPLPKSTNSISEMEISQFTSESMLNSSERKKRLSSDNSNEPQRKLLAAENLKENDNSSKGNTGCKLVKEVEHLAENHNLAETDDNDISKKGFQYVFPVEKKPHQRSKVPLKRIPIKMLD